MSSDGDLPPQPPKRRRLAILDSDSSGGSGVARAHRKRRVFRVFSDPDSTEDDDDDVVPKPVNRRKNYRVISDNEASYSDDSDTEDYSRSGEESTSSEWQSDWESASDDSEEEEQRLGRRYESSKSLKKRKKEKEERLEEGEGGTAVAAGLDSDASDGQSEKCPICLLAFGKQRVATPSCCEHCFCLLCLMEWSKNINTCPVDRQVFTSLHVRDKLGGKVKRQIPVEMKSNIEELVQEDPTYCEVCHQCDREDRMLLCDGCDLGYHLECLNPPMHQVPMDEWYCPDCSRNSQDDAEVVDIDLDEISDLMAEARGLGLSYGRTRTGIPNEATSNFGPHRMIPRTRQTERVRANIRADRDRTREARQSYRNGDGEARFDPEQPSTSSSGMDSISENGRSTTETRTRTMFGEASSGRRNIMDMGMPTSSRSSRRSIKSTRKSKKRKRRVTEIPSGNERMVRRVRIREFNDDGEEHEIVTYVNVAPVSTKRRKKRGKKSRKV